jgi:hypothetical protein
VLIVPWCTPLWPLLSTAAATAAIIVHRHRFFRPSHYCLVCPTLLAPSSLSSCRCHCR